MHTGDIAPGGSVTGVRIDLSPREAETAFVRAVTLPLKRVREAGEMTRIVLLVDALDESLASKTAEALPRLLGEVEYAHLLVTARPDHRAIGWLRERAECMDLLADAPPGSDDVLEYLQRRLNRKMLQPRWRCSRGGSLSRPAETFYTPSMSWRRSVVTTGWPESKPQLPAGCRCPREACPGSIATSSGASCGAMTAPGPHGSARSRPARRRPG